MVLVSEGLLRAAVFFKGGGKPGSSREQGFMSNNEQPFRNFKYNSKGGYCFRKTGNV